MKQLHITRTPGAKPTPDEYLETLPTVVELPQITPEPAKDSPPALGLPILPPVPEKERTQRLTLDIPASLHGAIKRSCAMRGTSIKDELVALLRMYYPDKS